MKPSTWRAFREEAKRSPDADRYEPLETDTWYSLEVFVPSETPEAILFFTKPFLCKRWLEQGAYPEHLFSMVRGGIPTNSYWRLIRDTAKRARLPICFIGDLDPYDLTTFLALRSGDPDLRRPSHQALPISYGGIDDTWLKLCERHTCREGYVPWFNMSALELKHRDVVLQMAPWLLDLVGPRCAEYLRSGRKIELEGACNPSFYDERFPVALRNHLLRRARVTPRRSRAPGR